MDYLAIFGVLCLVAFAVFAVRFNKSKPDPSQNKTNIGGGPHRGMF